MKKLDIDHLRRGFSQRFKELVDAEAGPKKIETFSMTAGVSLRQASQWGNPRHISWPSAANLIQVAINKNISLDWLLLGEGSRERKFKDK